MISEMSRGFRVSVDWPLLRPLVSWEQYPSSCVTLGSQSQEKATKWDLLFSTCYQHVITVGEELCLAVIMYFNLSISQSIGRSVGRSIFLSVCGSVYITSPSLHLSAFPDASTYSCTSFFLALTDLLVNSQRKALTMRTMVIRFFHFRRTYISRNRVASTTHRNGWSAA